MIGQVELAGTGTETGAENQKWVGHPPQHWSIHE